MIGKFRSDDETERDIRTATTKGALTDALLRLGDPGRAVLFKIVSDLVFRRYTVKNERARKHWRCTKMSTMEPECHDRHQDAVEAMLADLLKHADQPIRSLEAWMVPRLEPVIIDTHRQRRGESGAQQRPRLPLPVWLDAAIGGDPWLRKLSVEILTWVGVPTAAIDGTWPLTSWAVQRADATGVEFCTEAETSADVDRVLTAMRNSPKWYKKYVESPLGRKETSVAPYPRTDADRRQEPDGLPLVHPSEVSEARLARLAELAIEAVRRRLAAGDDVRKVAIEVIGMVFRGGAEHMIDRIPNEAPTVEESLDEILLDPDQVERIVRTLLEILDEES